MVLYYKDLNTNNETDNWLIPLIVVATVLLPLLIYKDKQQFALYIAIALAILQILAVMKNVKKNPL